MALLSLQVLCQPFPPGWRTATASELDGDERKDSPGRLARAEGDFNGDGVKDVAYVLKSKRFSGEALWMWLSTHSGRHRWISLDQTRWPKENPEVGLNMAVSVQKPGPVPYACFDAARQCNFGPAEARPKLALRHDGLVYFKPGSAASLYFWSAARSRFVRVWLSD